VLIVNPLGRVKDRRAVDPHAPLGLHDQLTKRIAHPQQPRMRRAAVEGDVRVDERTGDDLAQRQLGEHALGGDPLALGAGGDACKLVARLFLARAGQQRAQIIKDESFLPDGRCHDHESGSPDSFPP
jgi:hypothetical protein